jgi:hypothetical protein
MKIKCMNCDRSVIELWAMDQANNQRLICECGQTNIELIGFEIKAAKAKEV